MTRELLIQHIMYLKTIDPDYARYALKQYSAMFPDLDLNDGVRDAMRAIA